MDLRCARRGAMSPLRRCVTCFVYRGSGGPRPREGGELTARKEDMKRDTPAIDEWTGFLENRRVCT